jgi:hypothetical protein
VLGPRLGEEGCCDSEWLGPGSRTGRKLVGESDEVIDKNSLLLSQLGQNHRSSPSGERNRGIARHPLAGQVLSESFFKNYEIISREKVIHGIYIPIPSSRSLPKSSETFITFDIAVLCTQHSGWSVLSRSLVELDALSHDSTPNPTSTTLVRRDVRARQTSRWLYF